MNTSVFHNAVEDLKKHPVFIAMTALRHQIDNFPEEDRLDLYELSHAFFFGENEEERQSAGRAMAEILNPVPDSLVKLDLDAETTDRRWSVSVGEKIRAEREKANLTQEALAKKSGLRQSHISRVEGGQHSPSQKTLVKIANALGVELKTFDPCS